MFFLGFHIYIYTITIYTNCWFYSHKILKSSEMFQTANSILTLVMWSMSWTTYPRCSTTAAVCPPPTLRAAAPRSDWASVLMPRTAAEASLPTWLCLSSALSSTLWEPPLVTWSSFGQKFNFQIRFLFWTFLQDFSLSFFFSIGVSHLTWSRLLWVCRLWWLGHSVSSYSYQWCCLILYYISFASSTVWSQQADLLLCVQGLFFLIEVTFVAKYDCSRCCHWVCMVAVLFFPCRRNSCTCVFWGPDWLNVFKMVSQEVWGEGCLSHLWLRYVQVCIHRRCQNTTECFVFGQHHNKFIKKTQKKLVCPSSG